MKVISLVGVGALLAAVSMSAAFAETSRPYDPSAPKTRAQVIADLIEWRAAGYDPLNWIDYPDNALRAGQVVAARRAQESGGSTAQ